MKYGVILADPPWQYRVGKSHRGTAEREYPTMSDAEICALEVGELAAVDSVSPGAQGTAGIAGATRSSRRWS